jgi:hypothetical protein
MLALKMTYLAKGLQLPNMSEDLTWPAAIIAATHLTKPVVEVACDLACALLGRPLRHAGGLLGDEVYAWRASNRIRLLSLVKKKLDVAKATPRMVPAGFLLPLLDAAGDVEEIDLQELWANLLASGIKADGNQHPMFVHALKQMSSQDAGVLKVLAEARHSFPPNFASDKATFAAAERLIAIGLLRRKPSIEQRSRVVRVLAHAQLVMDGDAVIVTDFGKQFLHVVSQPDATS